MNCPLCENGHILLPEILRWLVSTGNGHRSIPGRREITMKKFLIAATICVFAAANFAAPAQAATKHRRAGGMGSMISKMMPMISQMTGGNYGGGNNGGFGGQGGSQGGLSSLGKLRSSM